MNNNVTTPCSNLKIDQLDPVIPSNAQWYKRNIWLLGKDVRMDGGICDIQIKRK